MATRKKTWVYNPPKQQKTKPIISEETKQDIQNKGNQIVEKIFKPQFLEAIPEEQILNHIVDIYTKWYRCNFYFCVKYKSPPNANTSSFENKFIRLEYFGDNNFGYSTIRHTGKWFPMVEMTLQECLKRVATEIPY